MTTCQQPTSRGGTCKQPARGTWRQDDETREVCNLHANTLWRLGWVRTADKR